MFKPVTIRIFSIVAIISCTFGLLLSIFLAVKGKPLFFLAAISWGLFIVSGRIGFQLSYYPLNRQEYTKVAVLIYLIIVSFVIFLLVGATVGVILGLFLLSALVELKRGHDKGVKNIISDPDKDGK